MAKYERCHVFCSQIRGRWVLEAIVWRGPRDVAQIRIDLDRLWPLLKQAARNNRGVCKRGPLQVRRPAWFRSRGRWAGRIQGDSDMNVVCKCGHRFAETLGRIGPTYGLTWLDMVKGSKTFRQKVKVCPGCGVELSRGDLQAVRRQAT